MLFLVILLVEATVIGIDFGTHWFKVSIIKPGGSVETVLNRESKRKTSNIITLNKGVRNFGTDAEQLSAKLPKDTFYSLKNLLGKTYDSVAEYRETFPNVMIASERNTCNFTTLGSSYSTEELVANLLAHAVRQATSYAGVGVTGAVITVPPYFSHFERRALLDAADIANLRVYGLVNDETAVAIKYALGKSFEQKEHHIFYDMGAGSTIASLVEFHSGFDKKISKKVIDLHVKATGYDATLGGQAVDVILQNFLASQFQKIHKTDLSSNTRAMARLLKEANRVKTILSANQDVMSSVENIHNGIDFKVKVTRKELSSLCQDLFKRSASPVYQIIESSGLKPQDINSIVLVGGGVRVPAVQAELSKAISQEKFARNIDGDEAAVYGAVWHGVSLSSLYQPGVVFRVKDLNPLSISLSYNLAGKKLDSIIYPQNCLLGQKKIVTFKKVKDFDFSVDYDDKKGVKTPIAIVHVDGLEKALADYPEIIGEPKVQVHLLLDESGILNIMEAKVTLQVSQEVKAKGIKDSVLGFFKGKDKKAEEGKEDDQPEPEETEEKTEKKDGSNDSKAEKKGTKTVSKKITLGLKIDWQTVVPLSDHSKKLIRARLEQMDQDDLNRAKLAETRNNLETLKYKVKELLYDDEAVEFATKEEASILEENVKLVADWLDDNSETATQEEFEAQLKTLSMFKNITLRRKEYEKRPEAVSMYTRAYVLVEAIHKNITQELIDEGIYTAADKSMAKSVFERDAEFNKTLQSQLELAKDQDSKVKVNEIKQRTNGLAYMIRNLNYETKYQQMVVDKIQKELDEKKKQAIKAKKDAKKSEANSAEKEGDKEKKESDKDATAEKKAETQEGQDETANGKNEAENEHSEL